MALIMEVMQTIARPVGQLALWLEETYQVDIVETMEKWRELTGMNITVKADKVITEEVESLDVTSTSSTKSKKVPKVKERETCQHKFKTGDRTGEQCTTKPKGGALYCSAHRPKDSVKLTKSSKVTKTTKTSKKQTDTEIDPDFVSDVETEQVSLVAAEPVEEPVVTKAKAKEVKPKKKLPVPTSNEEDSEEEVVSKPKKSQKKNKKKTTSINEDSEPEPDIPNKPLLKKKSVSKAVIPPSKQYNTEDEKVDEDLDLED